MSKRARTRAIRAQMAASGENYTHTRAAAQVGAKPSGDPTHKTDPTHETDPAREHVRQALERWYPQDQAELRRYEEHEHAGRRIVDMGQDGPNSWALHDWRTGERLARGEGGFDDFVEALERLDPENRWVERDGITEDVIVDVVSTPGIPDSLATALDEWIEQSSTTDEEIADFVGWSSGKGSAAAQLTALSSTKVRVSRTPRLPEYGTPELRN